MTSPLFDLTGRVAIVTGTSRGLGQAFARALARAGADLVVTSRSIASLRPFEQEIAALGPQGRFPRTRRSRRGRAFGRMADAAQDAFGRIDILVNNAGCNVRKRAAEVTWDDWNLVLDTNLRGTFFMSQAVVRAHDPRGRRPHRQHRLGHVRVRIRRPRRPTARAAAVSGSSR